MAPRRKRKEEDVVFFDDIDELSKEDTSKKRKEVFCIFGDICREMSDEIIIPLIQCIKQKTPAEIYLSSPGGDPMPALMLVDIIDRAESNVDIFLMGEVCSSGFLISLAGYNNEHVHKYAYPSSRVMWHSGSMCFEECEIPYPMLQQHMDYHNKNWDHMCEYILSHSKMTKEHLEECAVIDKWMFPDEMLELGIVDEIL